MTTSDKRSDGPARKPRAFDLDKPAPSAVPGRQAEERPSGKAARPSRSPAVYPATVELTPPEADPFLSPVPPTDPADVDPALAPPRRRRFTLGGVLGASLGILLSLAIGLWTDALVRDLFARAPWLGWIALAAAAAGVAALLILVGRELAGLRRLAGVGELRADLLRAGRSVSAKDARRLAGRVVALLGERPETARGRKELARLSDEIIDGPDYLAFTERELMSGLDRQARAFTLNAARRVSVVTAVSPRALVDLAYVVFESARLIRAIATLYGGRPGFIGMLRLFGDVIAHLAVTGAVAGGDSLIQQLVGHGLAAKLSARLGEGVINGLMTARIGISAMDLCRPMPFSALKRPGISDFMSDIARIGDRDTLRDRDSGKD